MLSNFFLSKEFNERFSFSFSYRYSAEYEQGFRSRVDTEIWSFPLRVVCSGNLFRNISSTAFKKILMLISTLVLMRFWILLWNTFLIWRTLGEVGKVDVLHVNNGGYPGARSCMAAVFAGRLRGVSHIVYVVNNIAVGYGNFQRWPDYLLDRMLVKYVDVFVTGSGYAREKLGKVLNLPPSQSKSIHNGIKLRDVTETRREVVNRLSLPESKVICGVVAVLEARKGHMFLLQAMNMLKEQGHEMPVLVIEGCGVEQEKLLDYVNNKGLAKDVFFIGKEDQIFNVLNMFDFVILPSTCNEDFPNIILESMGLGKPVIATDISGVPEQVVHMRSGILVPPSDAKALARAIIVLMKNPDLVKDMGKYAKERFDKKFSYKISIEEYMKLYYQLIKEK